MRDTDLSGVIAASLTPVTEALEVDVARLRVHVSGLLADGCSFVSTFGSTGEGASFSTAQKITALEAMAASGVDMARQIPGVISPTVDDASRMVTSAAELGCRAVLMLPPFYYSASEAGLAAFYDAALARAANSDIDIILYHIPERSRAPITLDLIRDLIGRHGDRIVGVKDSTGDIANGVALAREFPNLSIFTGDDRALPDLLTAGGAGIIGGMPNLFARDIASYYRSPNGNDAADQIRRAKARIDVAVANGDLLALKAALARHLNDPSWARTMPPLLPPSDEQVETVERAFAATGFSSGAAAA